MTSADRIRRHNITDLLAFTDLLDDLERHHTSSPDGYPTKTVGAATPTPTGHVTICDEITYKGTRPGAAPIRCRLARPCPEHDQLTTVEAAAAALENRPRPDPITTLHQRAHRELDTIANALDTLTDIRQATERIQGRTIDTDDHDQHCRIHLLHQRFETRYRGDLCRRCDTFRLTHSYLPTAAIIDAATRYGWTRIPAHLITQERPVKKKRKSKR